MAEVEGEPTGAPDQRRTLLTNGDDSAEVVSGLFRRLLETSPDGVLVVDETGRILFANIQAEQMFGYPANALLGENVDILVPSRLRTAHALHRQGYSAAPRLRAMGSGLTLSARARGGHELPVEISLSPIVAGGRSLFSANIRDITERRKNETALRRAQSQLLSAVESIQGAFALFDDEDRLVLCNSAYRQIIGPNVSGELVGRQFGDIVSASSASGAFELEGLTPDAFVERWMAHHRQTSGVLKVKGAGGQDFHVIERKTADGGIVATIWNVTDEMIQREELRRARALAEAASAAKSEFLASMSHELRTPLNAILGFAQLLQRDKKTPLSSRQQERLDHVLRGGEHLLRLIDDVLDLARIEAGTVLISPEPVNVAEVLAEVKETLEPVAARAQITLDSEPGIPPTLEVLADRTRLAQILMNFGSNAIKYGRPMGSARFCIESTASSVRLSVCDDGLGIPEAKQTLLFQPFQRAGQEAGPIEGTGIGLVITKRLAELMGGRVGFESHEGKGSRFWLELPRHVAMHQPASSAASVQGSCESRLTGDDGPRYVVIYVDDNPSSTALMQDLLGDFERVELLTAPNAEIGIELVRARRPDVVIMDINLPGMSGFEATQKLAGWPETRDIPVIALSAAAMIRDAARVAGAGFYRYLTKPVRVDELTSVLEELLIPDPPPP